MLQIFSLFFVVSFLFLGTRGLLGVCSERRFLLLSSLGTMAIQQDRRSHYQQSSHSIRSCTGPAGGRQLVAANDPVFHLNIDGMRILAIRSADFRNMVIGLIEVGTFITGGFRLRRAPRGCRNRTNAWYHPGCNHPVR